MPGQRVSHFWRTTMFVTIRGHTLYLPGIPTQPVVLDLGANRGEFSREFCERFGGTSVLVEANPVLAATLPTDGRFRSVNAAVAVQEGPVTFHLAKNDEGSSLLPLPSQSEFNCVLSEVVTVPGRRLETMLVEMGPRIDVLKMDIEGAEVAVLASLDFSVLATVGQLTVEFHCDPVFGYGGRDAVEQLLNQFEHHGFLALDFHSQRRLDVLLINRHQHPIGGLRRLGLRLRYRPPVWLQRAKALLPAFLKRHP
ncbi:hypothetical protein BH11PLA2_BH11PLA2_50490 [soil metagenome]